MKKNNIYNNACRGVLHTPENKFVANDVGVAVLGDPKEKKEKHK